MRILISIMFISSAHAFDMEKLKAEREMIKKEFLLKDAKISTVKATKKNLVRSRLDPLDKNIPDLENMYFDQVSTKAAAPRNKKRKLRAR